MKRTSRWDFPAPQTPYATELAAFDGEPARGIWKLWVYDDSALNIGEIESAELTVRTDNPYSFTFSGQTTPFSFSSDQPFVRFEGSVAHETVPYSFHWRNVVNFTFYEAGAFSRGPGPLDVFANVPLKAGSNVVTAFIRTTAGDQFTETRIVNVSEFTYSLAEGATGTFFDLDITLANPTAADAPIQVDFLPENGTVVPLLGQVDALSPKQFRVDDVRARRGRVDGRALAVGGAARGRAHDELGRARLRRTRRHVRRAGDALAVRRRLARLLRHVRAAGERQRDAGRRDQSTSCSKAAAW